MWIKSLVATTVSISNCTILATSMSQSMWLYMGGRFSEGNGEKIHVCFNLPRLDASRVFHRSFTDLVLGSRSVGFTSATFFSQSKMSQSSLTWDILNTVQGWQCHIVFPKNVQNCSTWPKLARQKCSKLLGMTPSWAKQIAQNCSKCFKMFQNDAECLKMSQNVSKRLNCHYLAVLLPVSIVAWA